MSHHDINAVVLERAMEQLRQEREAFDQQKAHNNRWFYLRLVMGYAAVVLIPAIILVASYILFNSEKFPASVVAYAGAALFADIIGLFISVWKIVLSQKSFGRLEPVTKTDMLDNEGKIS